MSQQFLRLPFLLATVISLSLMAVGCSSPASNSNNTNATPQATTAASTPTPGSTDTNTAQQPTPTPSAQPGSAEDYNQQGLASAKQGDAKSAEAAWRKSIELDPKNPKYHANLGVLLQSQGKLDEGITELKEAIRLNPNDAENHLKLAVAYGQQKKLDEAMTQAQEALRVKPDFAPAHVVMAAVSSAQGKQDDAVASLKTATDLFKKQGQTDQQVDTQIKLALALGQQKKVDEAIPQIQEAIALKPDFAPAHVLLAGALSDQGKKEEAIASLTKARDLFKTQGKTDALAETTLNLAVLLGQQQKLDESIAESKEAIRLKPDSAKAYYVLALALSTQGKKQEAIQNLTKTQELLKTQGKTEEADKIAQVIKQLGEQKQ